MNINNFEKQINKTILSRGYEYYIEGSIIDTYNNGDNEYTFQVQGSEDYKVVVKLDNNGEIIYSNCDCPYDFGPICKHQVAAYYELFEIVSNLDSNISTKKEVVKQPELREVLDDLSKEELINIIVDIAQKDDTLKNVLIVRYSKGDGEQELKKCKELIDCIVRKYTGREGFIKYRETYDFVIEMEALLEKARDTENTLLTLDISILVLEEAIEAFQYADDSNGEIGSLVMETIELIEEAAIDSDNSEINLREKIFDKLLELSDNRIFSGWEDYRINILDICAKFAGVKVFRDKLRNKIEYLINKSSNYINKKYSTETMLKILFDLIVEYGTKDEAEQFIKDNLTFTSFRELYIDKFISEKNYNKVIELAQEGEQKDKGYAGLVSKWKKIRYIAYKELSLKKDQVKLAKELLLDGEFEYYKELKELSEGDKEEFYSTLKQELKKGKDRYSRNIYLKLIIQENDLDEIIEYVRENPREIEKYAEKLVYKFRTEVIEIYKEYIKSVATASSNRRDYQGVCDKLKRYKKIAGMENQIEMKNELIDLNRKRPAFLDELSKIR